MKPYLRERDKDAKTSDVTGIVLTVGVHLVIFLCCAFTGMKYLYPPPQEQAFLIDFEEEPVPEVKRSDAGKQPEAEEIDLSKEVEIVQQSKSPVKSEKPNKTAEAKPDSHGDVEVPAPKEEINKNALFPGMSKKDSSLAPHGAKTPSAEFKAGQPKGNATVGKTEGTANARVKGRNVLGALPKPNGNGQDEGTVVVAIKVDQYGNVTEAKPGAQGTTVTNSALWNAARAAAMKTHFNQSADAPVLQEGTITYIFKLK
jgi:TonB family protein